MWRVWIVNWTSNWRRLKGTPNDALMVVSITQLIKIVMWEPSWWGKRWIIKMMCSSRNKDFSWTNTSRNREIVIGEKRLVSRGLMSFSHCTKKLELRERNRKILLVEDTIIMEDRFYIWFYAMEMVSISSVSTSCDDWLTCLRPAPWACYSQRCWPRGPHYSLRAIGPMALHPKSPSVEHSTRTSKKKIGGKRIRRNGH
jgi:hypothetical protein